MVTLSQKETADFIGLSARDFSRKLSGLIRDEGFPLPYMGDLTGRRGPRRRWLRAAISQWQRERSASMTLTPHSPANDAIAVPAGRSAPRSGVRGDAAT